jgi:hypothetical protein
MNEAISIGTLEGCKHTQKRIKKKNTILNEKKKNNTVQRRVKINELGLNKNYVLFLDSQNIHNQ